MKSLRLLLLLAVLPVLAGCPGIYSEQPLGSEVAVLDPAKVDGYWLGRGGLGGARVLDGEKGLLAWWDAADFANSASDAAVQCDPPEKVGAAVFRRHPAGSWCDGCFFYFASTGDASDKPHFTDWALLSDAESIAVYFEFEEGVQERLKGLIDSGSLPGRIGDGGGVVLGPLSPEHHDILVSRETGVFKPRFWGIFLRLPPALDPCKKAGPAK